MPWAKQTDAGCPGSAVVQDHLENRYNIRHENMEPLLLVNTQLGPPSNLILRATNASLT